MTREIHAFHAGSIIARSMIITVKTQALSIGSTSLIYKGKKPGNDVEHCRANPIGRLFILLKINHARLWEFYLIFIVFMCVNEQQHIRNICNSRNCAKVTLEIKNATASMYLKWEVSCGFLTSFY